MGIRRGVQEDVVDGYFRPDPALVRIRLTRYFGPVYELGLQGGVSQGYGQDPALDPKDALSLLDGRARAARYVRQRCQKQVAEAVAVEALPRGETVVE